MLSFTQIALAIPALAATAYASANCAAPVPNRSVNNCTAAYPGNAKSIPLLTAGDFTVLTKTGISCVPYVTVHGSIGVAPAAQTYITGFSIINDPTYSYATSSQIVGGVAYGADNTNSPTPQAVLDLGTAFDAGKGQSGPDYNELESGSLNGLSLYAGLYTWSTDVTLDDGQTLYLNGNANDTFVFQSSGSFNVGTYSHIVLGGGLTADSIYWVPSNSFLVGSNSTVSGTILAHKNIAFGAGTYVVGRAYSQTQAALKKGVDIRTAACAASGSC